MRRQGNLTATPTEFKPISITNEKESLESIGSLKDTFIEAAEQLKERNSSIPLLPDKYIHEITDEDNKKYLDILLQILEKLKIFPDVINEKSKLMYLLLFGMASSDFPLISLILRDTVKDQSTVSAVKTLLKLYNFLQMNDREYKQRILRNDPEYRKEVGDVISYFSEHILKKLNEDLESGKLKNEEMNFTEQIMLILKDKELFINIFILLHGSKYSNLITEPFMFDIIVKIIELQGKLMDSQYYCFEKLLKSMIGIKDLKQLKNIDAADGKVSPRIVPIEKRFNPILTSLLEIFFPELINMLPLIVKLVDITFNISKMEKKSKDKNATQKKLKDICRDIGLVFGCNTDQVYGIIGIIHSDIKALVTLTAPIHNIDPQGIKDVMKLLRNTKTTLKKLDSGDSKEKKVEIDDMKKASWEEVLKRVNKGNAQMKDLFDLVDEDSSGGISLPEFKVLMNRLNISLSDHRINEIFAKVKNNKFLSDKELNLKEFEAAMNYVQQKSTDNALFQLGLTTQQLILFFIVLTFILLLLFMFIFLGIAAFSTGGTFGSIVNSIMPVGAGTAVGGQKPAKIDGEEEKEKTKAVIESVTANIGSQE